MSLSTSKDGFHRFRAEIRQMLTTQHEAEVELGAMLPSILDKAFKGEL